MSNIAYIVTRDIDVSRASVRIYEVKDISNDVPVLPENRPPV